MKYKAIVLHNDVTEFSIEGTDDKVMKKMLEVCCDGFVANKRIVWFKNTSGCWLEYQP